MPSIVTPAKQQLSVDPYTSKLFDFDNSSSRVYLSRTINNLLRAFGTDVIIENLFIRDLLYNPDDEVVSLTVTSGKCIIDTTLIEFITDTDISINTSGYDSNGSLLLFISFRFAESIYENLAKIKLVYIDPTNRFAYPEPIEFNSERICLAKFNFDKELNTITKSKDAHVTVGNKQYEIYPLNNMVKSVRDYVNLLFN